MPRTHDRDAPPDPRVIARIGPSAYCVRLWLHLEPELINTPELLAQRCGIGLTQLNRTFRRLAQFGYEMEGQDHAQTTATG